MKQFLQNIQNAPEHVKTRWLVGLSAATMVVVIFLWLSYFNTLIEPAPTQQATAKPQEESFWETMKHGATVLGSSFGKGLRGLGAILEAPRSHIINP